MPRFAFLIQEVITMWKKLFLAYLFVLFASSPGHTAEQRYSIPIDKCPYLGPVDAPITIIEFLDFQ